MRIYLSKKLFILLPLFLVAVVNTAIADINVTDPNSITDVDKYMTIDFGTINVNWSDFYEYKVEKLEVQSFDYNKQISAIWNYIGVHLDVFTPIMPIYNSTNYINSNNTNVFGNRSYKVFQLENDYLGYIITAGHGKNNEPDNNVVNIKTGDNQIYPTDTHDYDVYLHAKHQTIHYLGKYAKEIAGKIFISIVVIPTANMQAGIVNINETIGKLKIYEADWKAFAGYITTYHLNIKGKLNITLPSCSVDNASINLGSVPKQQIEAGNSPLKSASLTINCPSSISNIYAKAYDINYPQNRDDYGRLGIKCGSGNEAKGVSVEVKVDNKLPKLSEKTLSVVPKYNLTTGQALADNKLLDLGNISGTKNIDIEARYVKHANNTYHPSAQVTTGCANAGMGLIFNYR